MNDFYKRLVDCRIFPVCRPKDVLDEASAAFEKELVNITIAING